MLDEPSIPGRNGSDDEFPEIPSEVAEIISQLKLLYALGGEETVSTALQEAGLPDEVVAQMVARVRESMEDEPPLQ